MLLPVDELRYLGEDKALPPSSFRHRAARTKIARRNAGEHPVLQSKPATVSATQKLRRNITKHKQDKREPIRDCAGNAMWNDKTKKCQKPEDFSDTHRDIAHLYSKLANQTGDEEHHNHAVHHHDRAAEILRDQGFHKAADAHTAKADEHHDKIKEIQKEKRKSGKSNFPPYEVPRPTKQIKRSERGTLDLKK